MGVANRKMASVMPLQKHLKRATCTLLMV